MPQRKRKAGASKPPESPALQPEHIPSMASLQEIELDAMRRMLKLSAGTFSLSVAICNSRPLRDQLIDKLRTEFKNVVVFEIPANPLPAQAGMPALPFPAISRVERLDVYDWVMEKLKGVNAPPAALFLLNLDDRLSSGDSAQPLLRALNASRELWPAACPFPLVFWLPEFAATLLSIHARDLWAWKSHQFEFAAPKLERLEPRALADSDLLMADNLSAQQKRFRIAELEQRIHEAGDSPPKQLEQHVLEWWNELGSLYRSLGEPRRAIEIFEQGQALARRLINRGAEGAFLGNLGNAWADLGETRKAIGFHEQALAIHREIGDRHGEGSALGNLGLAWADLGETRQALEFHEQALAISRKIGDKRGEANDLGNLGNAWEDLGETRKAIGFYEQALVINREIGNPHGEGNALGNLGVALKNLGETRKAIGFYEQALVINREIGNPHGEGNALGNLGVAWKNLGETRKAIEFYEQALAIHREIGDRSGEGNALCNLGAAWVSLGEPVKAIEFYEQALAIHREIGDSRGEGIDHHNLAGALEKISRRDEALDHAEQALAIFEQIESHEAAMARELVERLRRGKRD